MRKIINGGVALALLAGLAAPAVAAPMANSAATPSPAAVTLPFAPPVGTPLLYDFEMRTEVGGTLRQQVRSVDELTYTAAAGGGYVLSWKTTKLSVEAPGVLQKVLEKTYGALIGTPMLIAVSKDGAIEKVINAAEIRAMTETALAGMVTSFDAEMAAAPPEARATFNKMMTALLEQQRQQSDEAFAQSLLEGPSMMLPSPGPLVPGQPVTSEAEQPSPLGGGNIRFLVQVLLNRYDPGVSAEIHASSIANPEDARRAANAFIATLLASIADPEKRKEAEAGVAKLGPMTISDEAVITMVLPAGLAETMQYRKQVSVPGQAERLDTRSYKRAQ